MEKPKTGKKLVVSQELIPFGDIIVSPENNTREDVGDIEDLRASIETHGLMHPLGIVYTEAGALLCSGFRRYAAIQEIRKSNKEAFAEVPVCSVKGNIGNVRILNLTENLQRDDLTPPEIVKGVLELKEAGMSQGAIAKALSKTQPYISMLIKVGTKLTDENKRAFEAGEIPLSVAYDLAGIKPEKQQKVADEYLGKTEESPEAQAPAQSPDSADDAALPMLGGDADETPSTETPTRGERASRVKAAANKGPQFLVSAARANYVLEQITTGDGTNPVLPPAKIEGWMECLEWLLGKKPLPFDITEKDNAPKEPQKNLSGKKSAKKSTKKPATKRTSAKKPATKRTIAKKPATKRTSAKKPVEPAKVEKSTETPD